MEGNKKSSVLLLLLFLPLLLLCAAEDQNCPSVPDITFTDLSCSSDFDQTISCLWNSSVRPHQVCTLHAKRKRSYRSSSSYNSSCILKPIDDDRPALRRCSLVFRRPGNFQTVHQLILNLICEPSEQILTVSFMPACHIKLNPPPPPDVNFTTVSWSPQDPRHGRLRLYESQLQWKRQDQSWSENNVRTTQCSLLCNEELDPDQLLQDGRYEGRVRVKTIDEDTESLWSDWSPTASWVSPVGRRKQPPSGFIGSLSAIFAGVAVFAMFLVVIRFKTDKTTWVYMVKRIRGKPLPNPAHSFLQNVDFQSWLSAHFTRESCHPLFKPVAIVSVEVTSTLDDVTPGDLEVAPLEKMSSYESTGFSNFSNPSYSQLCPPPPPPPISSLTAGNLAPCEADTPYGPVGGQGDGSGAEQDEVRGKEVEIHQLLSKSCSSADAMLVVSDYEKTEKIQVERVRLQSLDSGVCSGEEVSQESLEANSLGEADGGRGSLFHKLFGGVSDQRSIQVCSGYERVQTDGAELLSLDSGLSTGEEDQVGQESSSLLAPPPSSCSLPFLTPQPLDCSGPGLSPGLSSGLSSGLSPGLSPGHFLETMALMSAGRPVEPPGGGYMPVRADQS